MLDRWREASKSLLEERIENLPVGIAVVVDCPQYKGPGIIVPTSQDCPPDKIPVLLPNENIWWYPIDMVKRSNDPSSATRPTRAFDCNLDAMAGFAAAHG